mgnify:FL=1
MIYLVTLLLIITRRLLFLIIFSPIISIYFNKKKKLQQNDKYAENDKQTKKHLLKKKIARYYSGFVRYYLLQTSIFPSHHIRNLIYQKICAMNIAPKAIIYYGAEIREPYNISIGTGSIIGDKAILDGRNKIIIGENVNLSSNVQIWTEQHDHRDPEFRCSPNKQPVIIKDRVWIGPNSIILHSVTIGEGAVIAAGSIVTKNVEPYTIVAGIPAKKINNRNTDLHYTFTGEYIPFL